MYAVVFDLLQAKINKLRLRMKEITFSKTRGRNPLIKPLGITVLALLMLVGITGAAPYAYITHSDSHVYVIDTATNKVVSTVNNVGTEPYGVAVNPTGTRVYLTSLDYQGGAVTVINATVSASIATVYVGESPYGLAVTSDGTKVYVANWGSDSVSVIDTSTNTVTATVPVGSHPFGIAVNPAATKVYVTNTWNNSVSVIDTATNNVTTTIDVGNYPEGIAVTPDGSKVYVANDQSGNVSVIDTATNTVAATVNYGGGGPGITVSPDGKKVYVSNCDDGTVSVIDTATNSITATVPVGDRPVGIEVTPDGSKLYVANWRSNNISVIDTTTNNVITTMNIGNELHWGPNAFGKFIGGNKELPVANFTSNVTSGYAPLSVQFTDLSENATSLNWNFGEGNLSTERNPVHTYSKAGNYTIKLNAIGANGTSSKFAKVVVMQKISVLPVANFTSNVTSGNVPLSVQFTDLSENATEWYWDFGDGNNSDQQNPTHTYAVPGVYTVNLTVSNVIGTDSKLATITVSSESVFLSFNPQKVDVLPGYSQDIQIIMDEVPEGLSGFNITFSVSDPEIAEITAVSFPGWGQLPKNSTLPSSSVWIKTVDLENEVHPGDTNVLLGTITVTGKNTGISDLSITKTMISDDNGSLINPAVDTGKINVVILPAFPGYTNLPSDLNQDGLYEDINGNGMLDFNDVVAFYNNMDWIEENVPLKYFDYNKNGLIDFDDVVKLYDML